MAQSRIMIGSTENDLKNIWQPDTGISWKAATTYTEESKRSTDGDGHFTEMFTTHAYEYKASNIPADEASKILKMITGKKYFLRAYSPYDASWKTIKCYSGEIEVQIGTLEDGKECFDSLQFQAIGVKKLV